MDGAWIYIIIWLGFALATAFAADGRGRNMGVWFLVGVVFGALALIAVLMAGPKDNSR